MNKHCQIYGCAKPVQHSCPRCSKNVCEQCFNLKKNKCNWCLDLHYCINCDEMTAKRHTSRFCRQCSRIYCANCIASVFSPSENVCKTCVQHNCFVYPVRLFARLKSIKKRLTWLEIQGNDIDQEIRLLRYDLSEMDETLGRTRHCESIQVQ